MTIEIENNLTAFQNWFRPKRNQRRRIVTIHTLNALPCAVQRDIGWGSAYADRR